MTAHKGAPALLLIGTGERHYRQDALKSLADRYSVLLLDDTAPTWQQPFLTGHQVADLSDTTALRAVATSLATAHDIGGVLTWNPAATVPAAAIAELLDTAGLYPAAAHASRNQAAARAVLDAHGVAAPRWVPVGDAGQLRIAAEHLGYPLVLKPAIAGSAGAVRVGGSEQLDAAYAFTAQTVARHGTASAGLLAEEYQGWPEVGVEVVSIPGRHVVAAITHTQRGETFEATDRLVAPALRSPVTDAAEQTAIEALKALDITHGVSHVTVRLTSTGPRVIAVTPCLADDLIPHLPGPPGHRHRPGGSRRRPGHGPPARPAPQPPARGSDRICPPAHGRRTAVADRGTLPGRPHLVRPGRARAAARHPPRPAGRRPHHTPRPPGGDRRDPGAVPQAPGPRTYCRPCHHRPGRP